MAIDSGVFSLGIWVSTRIGGPSGTCVTDETSAGGPEPIGPSRLRLMHVHGRSGELLRPPHRPWPAAPALPPGLRGALLLPLLEALLPLLGGAQEFLTQELQLVQSSVQTSVQSSVLIAETSVLIGPATDLSAPLPTADHLPVATVQSALGTVQSLPNGVQAVSKVPGLALGGLLEATQNRL